MKTLYESILGVAGAGTKQKIEQWIEKNIEDRLLYIKGYTIEHNQICSNGNIVQILHSGDEIPKYIKFGACPNAYADMTEMILKGDGWCPECSFFVFDPGRIPGLLPRIDVKCLGFGPTNMSSGARTSPCHFNEIHLGHLQNCMFITDVNFSDINMDLKDCKNIYCDCDIKNLMLPTNLQKQISQDIKKFKTSQQYEDYIKKVFPNIQGIIHAIKLGPRSKLAYNDSRKIYYFL